jgi:hypothetical protein
MNKTLLIIIIVVAALMLCCCIAIGGYFIYDRVISEDSPEETWDFDPFNSQENSSNEPDSSTWEQDNGLVENYSPELPAEETTGEETWLVMLYQDADDEILERDMFIDLNEAEIIGSSDQLHIVAQLDRFASGSFDGDGNWSTTKRFYVTQDNDLDHLGSVEIADLGEVNMGSPEALIDFGTWAIQNYPADKYVLILSNHGAGWTGGWNDDDPIEYSELLLNDIEYAFAEIINRTGISHFDLIGFDACLMGQLEVFNAAAPYARYAVASEESEPALGWAYAAFLGQLAQNPGMSSAQLASNIVESYIDQDQRIVDDTARRAYIQENYYSDEDISASDLVWDTTLDSTLSAINLAEIYNVNQALNQLTSALTSVNQSDVAAARSYAQSYDNIFDDDLPPSFLDLGNLALMLKEETGDPQVGLAAENLMRAIQTAVIAEKHGPERPGSTGISIYFPNSELYEWTAYEEDFYPYTVIANSFARNTTWDDYLAYHYAGQDFDVNLNEAATLSQGSTITAPGLGQIEIAPLTASANTIQMDESTVLQTSISGSNIGFVYIDVSFYYEYDGSFLTTDMDFISGDDIKEINGVYYPDWNSNNGMINIEYTWEPVIFYVNDGINSEFALIYPFDYGPPDQDAIYAVDGIYTSTASGEQYDAVIYFTASGEMREIMGYSNTGDIASAPREITPRQGDQFTIIDEWFENGEFVSYEGGTLTFGDQNFFFEAYYPEEGYYYIDVIVEDLDGNWYVSDPVEIYVYE